MHTPQSRVSAEAIEVAARLKKLVAFIDGPGFSALSAAHRDRDEATSPGVQPGVERSSRNGLFNLST